MTLTEKERNSLSFSILNVVIQQSRIQSCADYEDFGAFREYNESAKVINKFVGPTLNLYKDWQGIPY